MVFNYSKLNGKIVEVCGTQSKFAELMGLSEKTISLKLNNKIMFKQDEILKAIKILRVPVGDVQEYFFQVKVQNF